jgi:signal transduction histidine kinase
LVQRGDVPAEVVSLARRQERELRAWLNGRPVDGEAVDLRGAIDAVATRVEEMHQVPVDTVVVGDVALDDAGRAIALACQEAAINAARHSGAARVSIYVEAEPREITAYVRDEGRGFDRGAVPPDRRGISESIVGRMRRLSGSVTITSSPGHGTEVQLHIPRSPG